MGIKTKNIIMRIDKQHTNCRVCNSTNLSEYLDLGLLPLSNNLESTKEMENSLNIYLNIKEISSLFNV